MCWRDPPDRLRPMTYDVFLSADGAPREALLDAQRTFRRVLNAELGSEAQVLLCFRARQRVMDQGGKALSPEEDRDSAAWILANDKAEAAVKSELGLTKVGFTFRIAHP